MAIITTSIVMVIRQFNIVKRDLNVEQELSRINETVLSSNIDITNNTLRKRIVADSNNEWAQLRTINTDVASLAKSQQESALKIAGLTGNVQVLSESYPKLESELGTLETTFQESMSNLALEVNSFLSHDTNGKRISTNEHRVLDSTNSTYGSMMYNSKNGLVLSNMNPIGLADISTDRASIGKSLNLAGTLSFANNNSSYMLGVDGTSMYLNMNSNNFVVRNAANTKQLDVGQSGVTVGNFALANPLSDTQRYVFGIEGTEMYMKPDAALPSGTINIRDSMGTNRLSVHNSNITITGDALATNNITSQGNLCVDNVCLTRADMTKLQAFARAPAA